MISIKRRRQIKFAIIFSIIFIIIITSVLIIGFFPYGLHKKYMHKVRMPKDSVVYISAKNLNGLLKSEIPLISETFNKNFNNLKNNSNLENKIIYTLLTRRNSAVLLWQFDNNDYSKDNNNLEDSELFYFLDTGRLINFLANNFFTIKELNIGNSKYRANKINYDGMKFYIIGEDKPFLYLAFYKGLLIITKNYINLKKIIYFLSSKTNTLSDVDILNKNLISYNTDISFYVNKTLFDIGNSNINDLLGILKYFKTDIYGGIKFYKNNAKLSVFAEGSNIYNFYSLIRNVPIKILDYTNGVIKDIKLESGYTCIDIDLK